MNNKLKYLLVLCLGTFILMFFGLYNGFPVVSGDTEVYLKSGFEGIAAAERPVFYGLFVRYTSLGFSVWLTIFAQGFLLAYLLIRFMRYFIPVIPDTHLIALLLTISLGTISSWYVGQLMPDIFTPVLGLALFGFFFFDNSRIQKFVLAGIILLATLVHFSHYVILSLGTILLCIVILSNKKLRQAWKVKVFIVSIITIVSWFSLMTSNFLAGRGFVTSSVSHVFLMGKFCESGVLKTYLEKACPIRDYKICHYKDNLPPVAWEFVWDQANSPVFKTGGWDANKDEYDTIIKDICSRPKYWGFMAYKAIEATSRQVILTNIDEGEERPWIKFEDDHPLFIQIGKCFPHEVNLFKYSRQNTKVLDYTFYDHVYIVVMLLSILLLLWYWVRDVKDKLMPMLVFFIFYMLLNAFSTAILGNVLSRLNSRNIWLLPMVCIVSLYYIYRNVYINKALGKI